MLRVFIAVSLPGAIQQAIGRVIDSLKMGGRGSAVRWVPPGNIHLTLKFLGDVPENAVRQLCQSLENRMAEIKSFPLTVAELGAYPGIRRPRVIWVGIQPSADLLNLQGAVETTTARLGFTPEDRPFSAHLTLGRIRQGVPIDQMNALAEMLGSVRVGELGIFNVQSVEVYQSQLAAGGSIYSRLASAQLKLESQR